MTIGTVAFWGIVAWAVVSVTRCRPWREPPPVTPPPPITQRAEEILDERLARGDLDVDEYRRRRDALHAPRPPLRRDLTGQIDRMRCSWGSSGGYSSFRPSRVSARISITTASRTHLRSAGMTYHGAHFVEVRSSISRYASM